MKVYKSPNLISPEQMLALPRECRGTDWYGTPLPTSLSWSVALDSESLWFVCALPGGERSLASHGEFFEGLWEGDVAELFIKSPSGEYQELNVAPSGAWWSVTFDAYRVRRTLPIRPNLRYISTTISAGEWSVVAAFSRASMEISVTDQSLLHVSGMWYREQPSFLSSCPPQDLAPDYHLPECFQPVVMTPPC
ncbi:MAG: hypothetical protein RIS36_123 [Pseudomonadota bacterium]|jgi:hypothetical protein